MVEILVRDGKGSAGQVLIGRGGACWAGGWVERDAEKPEATKSDHDMGAGRTEIVFGGKTSELIGVREVGKIRVVSSKSVLR